MEAQVTAAAASLSTVAPFTQQVEAGLMVLEQASVVEDSLLPVERLQLPAATFAPMPGVTAQQELAEEVTMAKAQPRILPLPAVWSSLQEAGAARQSVEEKT